MTADKFMEVCKWVGYGVLFIVAMIIGFEILLTAGSILVAFASTGIGSFILLFIIWRCYIAWKKSN